MRILTIASQKGGSGKTTPAYGGSSKHHYATLGLDHGVGHF